MLGPLMIPLVCYCYFHGKQQCPHLCCDFCHMKAYLYCMVWQLDNHKADNHKADFFVKQMTLQISVQLGNTERRYFFSLIRLSASSSDLFCIGTRYLLVFAV
jgi:hypothetical protein